MHDELEQWFTQCWRLQRQEAFTERMFTNANLAIIGGLILGAIAAELKQGRSR